MRPDFRTSRLRWHQPNLGVKPNHSASERILGVNSPMAGKSERIQGKPDASASRTLRGEPSKREGKT